MAYAAPLIVPLLSNLSPGGTVPEVTLNPTGGTPPVIPALRLKGNWYSATVAG